MTELANVFKTIFEGLKMLAEIYSWDVPDVMWIVGLVYVFIFAFTLYLAQK